MSSASATEGGLEETSVCGTASAAAPAASEAGGDCSDGLCSEKEDREAKRCPCAFSGGDAGSASIWGEEAPLDSEEEEEEEEEVGSKGGMLETTANGVDGGDEKTVVKESSCCRGAGD